MELQLNGSKHSLHFLLVRGSSLILILVPFKKAIEVRSPEETT
jgi:hypothetical protein